jgi:hypothetical protein
MTTIEEEYQRRMFSLSGGERVRRSVAMFDDVKQILVHKVRRAHPGLSETAILRAVANRMYGRDARAQALLGSQRS